MIEQVVQIPAGWRDHRDPVIQWLYKEVGAQAPFPDCVDLDRPWHVNYNNGYIELSFARAIDATMFILRWS